MNAGIVMVREKDGERLDFLASYSQRFHATNVIKLREFAINVKEVGLISMVIF